VYVHLCVCVCVCSSRTHGGTCGGAACQHALRGNTHTQKHTRTPTHKHTYTHTHTTEKDQNHRYLIGINFHPGTKGEPRYLPVDIVLGAAESAKHMYVLYIYPEEETLSFEDAVKSFSSLDDHLHIGCAWWPVDEESMRQSIAAVQSEADPCSAMFATMIRVIRCVYV
jgi:hypothetical protein